MAKTILITGATDGIGLATAQLLAESGHKILLHGRDENKLKASKERLTALNAGLAVESYRADLSQMDEVSKLAQSIQSSHDKIDVLINNAGVYKTPLTTTPDGLDTRFAVNTIAPYLLTKLLLPLLGSRGRVINLSSAAQSSVNLEALKGTQSGLDDMEAYAQSKLAITMWSRQFAQSLKEKDMTIIAVNPGSLLASKMVRDGFGVAGSDIMIGAKIIARLALEPEFRAASGKYYDNDNQQFASSHPDLMDDDKCEGVIAAMEEVLASQKGSR